MYFYSQALQDRSEGRKAKEGGKGSGRLSTAEQTKENALHAAIVLLKRGILPDDPKTVVPPLPPRSSASLLTSAASHSQFHASQNKVPQGHIKPRGNHDDDDDDVEEPSFGSYYRITPIQAAFNLNAIQKYIGKHPSANNMPCSTEIPQVS